MNQPFDVIHTIRTINWNLLHYAYYGTVEILGDDPDTWASWSFTEDQIEALYACKNTDDIHKFLVKEAVKIKEQYNRSRGRNPVCVELDERSTELVRNTFDQVYMNGLKTFSYRSLRSGDIRDARYFDRTLHP